MRTTRSFTLALALALFGCLAQAQTATGPKNMGDIAVVVNSVNPVSDLSAGDLRRMLLGDRRFWGGNVQIRLALREHGARERDQVVAAILKMDNKAYSEHWRAKVFRGEASDEPLTLSAAMALQYVKETPGALSFASAKNLPPELKVLKIDGKLPGDPGYILK
jgi:hypothetical protein